MNRLYVLGECVLTVPALENGGVAAVTAGFRGWLSLRKGEVDVCGQGVGGRCNTQV
jgi:hypothetical protein